MRLRDDKSYPYIAISTDEAYPRVYFTREPHRRDRLYLHADYAGIRRAAAIIAVSQLTRYDLVSHLGVPADRVHVVYEGVDLDRFRPRPKSYDGIRYLLALRC